jgi:hypothetical protein
MNDVTDVANGTPECPADRRQAWDKALADARKYLTATVDAVHPDLSARSLLRYANEYRRHLATLVAASVGLAEALSGQEAP